MKFQALDDYLNTLATAPRSWRQRVRDLSGRPATEQTWQVARVIFKDAFMDLVARDASLTEFALLAQAELAFRDAFQDVMVRTGHAPKWMLGEPKWCPGKAS